MKAKLGRPKTAKIAHIPCPVLGPGEILPSQDVAAGDPEIWGAKNRATDEGRFGRPKAKCQLLPIPYGYFFVPFLSK
jgi:hypothetical protein